MTAALAVSPDERIDLATFRIGGRTFAVDIMRIREVLRPVDVVEVPNSGRGLLGVFSLRGAVIPLFEMWDPTQGPADTSAGRFVILGIDGRRIALLVDEVGDVVPVARRDIRLSDAVLSGDAAAVFVGLVHREPDLIFLVNVRQLVSAAGDLSLETSGLLSGGEIG